MLPIFPSTTRSPPPASRACCPGSASGSFRRRSCPALRATLALIAVLYLFYRRALGSWRAAMRAQLIFFTGGGLGWLLFLGDVAAMPPGGHLDVPPREYTLLPELGIWWSNVVTTLLLPQRALLMGLPLALGIYLSLGSRRASSAAPGTHRALVLAAGVGLLAATHVHSVLALAVLCAALAATTLREWRRWAVFASAAGLAVFLVSLAFYSDAATRGFLAWQPGRIGELDFPRIDRAADPKRALLAAIPAAQDEP